MKARSVSAPRGVTTEADQVQNYAAKFDDFNRAEAARNDLLALGIDLDNDLINRLQQNLGANLTLGAASKAATVLRGRSSGKAESVTYRNFNPTTASGNALQTIRTHHNDTVQVDMQLITSVLKELNNRDSLLEPQRRSSILKMLEHLRILYTRGPDAFIKAMHSTSNHLQTAKRTV